MSFERPARLEEMHFEVFGLKKCLPAIETDINKKMLRDLELSYRDPAPQVSLSDVYMATAFLKQAMLDMKDTVQAFQTSSLTEADEFTIQCLQRKSRASSMRLVLMLADNMSTFEGGSSPGPLDDLTEYLQSARMRTELVRFQKFFGTFCEVEWLGKQYAEEAKTAGKDAVLKLIACLLRPCRTSPFERDLKTRLMDQRRRVLKNIVRLYLNHDEVEDVYDADACEGVWTMLLTDGMKCQVRPSGMCGYQDIPYPPMPDEKTWENLSKRAGVLTELIALLSLTEGLASQTELRASTFQGNDSSISSLRSCIMNVSEKLWPGEPTAADVEELMRRKMSAINEFVQILNTFPDVFKQYILLRVGEMRHDVSSLRQLVSHEEALQAFEMLEEFRDEAGHARALIRTSASEASWELVASNASVKAYLFDKAFGATPASKVDGQDAQDVKGRSQEGNGDVKTKRSHHQRKRKQKFFQKMPRTNSSHS